MGYGTVWGRAGGVGGGGGGWLQYIRRNEGFFFNQVFSIADIIHIVCIIKSMRVYTFFYGGGRGVGGVVILRYKR